MLKELAQYIVGLSAPEVVDINGKKFSDRNLKRYDYKAPEPLRFKSITGLLEYIETDCDSTYEDLFRESNLISCCSLALNQQWI